MYPFGSRNRNGAAIVFAALAVAGSAGAAPTAPPREDRPPYAAVAAGRLTAFSENPSGAFLLALTAREAATAGALDIGPFMRLADEENLSPVVALSGAAASGAPPPSQDAIGDADAALRRIEIPTRSDGAAPAPVPTAIEAALVQLIVHDGPVNPIGAGDWRAARAAIGAFYADRGFRPVWVDEHGLTSAGRAAIARIKRAGEDGLNLSAFPLPRDIGASPAPTDLASAETTISAAVVAYAEQATGSRIDPAHVSRLVAVEPILADPGDALAETAAASDPGERLLDFNPPQRGYRALRDQLTRLDEIASGGGRRSDRGALSLDLMQTRSDADDALSDPGIDGSPRRSRLGPRRVASTASVNPGRYGPSARERAAILANMEMWRWEPRDMGERRIEVNVADFSVSVLDGDTVIHHARVVVGKPDTPTPIFSNVMRYVLINPSWRVPDSIIRKEMLPKLEYLSHHGYEVKTVNGRLTVRQLPGERNALGRLAFMFPNDHSVYLHDTPSQELFDEDARAFSHGCIRVEDPIRLAELVLGWPEERIDAAIGGQERTVFLPRPLPVHIEYFTEFVDESGELQQRPDVYGLTHKVAGILSTLRQD